MHKRCRIIKQKKPKKNVAAKPQSTAACTSKVEIDVIEAILLAMKVVENVQPVSADVDDDSICRAQS